MYGLSVLSSSLRAACAPQDTCRMLSLTARFLWYSSAHLNLSLSLQTAICRGMAFPCCTSGQRPSFQPSMFALWKTFSAGSPSCHVTSKEIGPTQFRIPFGTRYHKEQLLIPGRTAGLGAGFSRSTSGCGAMGGHCPERSLWVMQKRCAGGGYKSQDAREPKP